jgi:hypothetical protein
MLACADATLTQRLTSAACDSAWAPLCELVMNAVVVAVLVPVGVGVADELVGAADADGLAEEVVLLGEEVVLVGVTVGLVVGVRVGTGVLLDEGELVELAFFVGDGLALVGVGFGVVGVGLGVVGVGFGAVGVGVGVVGGLGVAMGVSGSHDSPLDTVAALAGGALAAAARVTPEAAVIRTLPVISVTVAGRA